MADVDLDLKITRSAIAFLPIVIMSSLQSASTEQLTGSTAKAHHAGPSSIKPNCPLKNQSPQAL